MKVKGTPYTTFSYLGGRVVNLRRLARTDSKHWSCFNPSIAYSPTQGYAATFRSSNYIIKPESGELYVETGGHIRNKVYFSELDDDLKIVDLRELDFSDCTPEMKRGVEDAKLFWRDNKWQFTGVVVERDIPRARMCMGAINPKTNKVSDLKMFGAIDVRKPEKNWMLPYKENKNFDFVYGSNAIVKGDKIIHTMMTDKRLSALRGNTNLHDLGDGTYLTLMHIMYSQHVRVHDPRTFGMRDGLLKNYTHVFARFNEYGKIAQLGEEFQFVGPGIEFAAGLVEKDNELVISFGQNDVSSHLGFIKKSEVLNSLVDID